MLWRAIFQVSSRSVEGKALDKLHAIPFVKTGNSRDYPSRFAYTFDICFLSQCQVKTNLLSHKEFGKDEPEVHHRELRDKDYLTLKSFQKHLCRSHPQKKKSVP